jgi:hypothetical protein
LFALEDICNFFYYYSSSFRRAREKVPPPKKRAVVVVLVVVVYIKPSRKTRFFVRAGAEAVWREACVVFFDGIPLL